MIRGLHHIGMATRDLDRLQAFYCDLFGAEVRRELRWDAGNAALSARLGLDTSAGRLVFLALPGAGLELFQFDDPAILREAGLRSVARPGLTHICFEVDDCAAEYDRLVRAGVRFHAEPLVMPTGGVFAYGRDPDGNVVEILQVPPA